MSFDSVPKPYELIKAGEANELELVESLLPQFDDTRKTSYLVLRSVSFLKREALLALDLDNETYNYWIDTDEVFKQFESKQLRYIQGHVAREVLRAGFMRNVFLQLAIDTEVMRNRAFNKEAMSSQDREDAREAGRRYNAQSISAMSKILGEPQGEEESAKGANYDFFVPIAENAAEEILNKRAQAKALLAQFSKAPSTYNENDGNEE